MHWKQYFAVMKILFSKYLFTFDEINGAEKEKNDEI